MGSRVGGQVADGGGIPGGDRVVSTGSRTAVDDAQGIRSRDRVVCSGSRDGGAGTQGDHRTGSGERHPGVVPDRDGVKGSGSPDRGVAARC